MPALDLRRTLGSARCVLARPQPPPLPVRVPQFWSTLCFSPKTQACKHPQPCPGAQTAVHVHWLTARPPCVSYRYLPNSLHPHAVPLEMRLLLVRISDFTLIHAGSTLSLINVSGYQPRSASKSSACCFAAPVAPTCTMGAEMQSCKSRGKGVSAIAASSILGLVAFTNTSIAGFLRRTLVL